MEAVDTDVSMEAIDLCAGPGGWSVAARDLGWHELGVEIDDAACATRRAAGLPTLQGDIAALDPLVVLAMLPGRAPLVLIASPPCTTFSMAGKGVGRTVIEDLVRALHRVAVAPRHSDIAEIRQELVEKLVAAGADHDDAITTTLVLEPMRWVRDLRPAGVALEQVKPVLPLWQRFVQILRDDLGYRSAWTGVLNSADYGVPQTRERAIAIASLDGVVTAPPATHAKGGGQGEDLFGDSLLPWVSMAQALGWTSSTVVATRGDRPADAGGGNEFDGQDRPSWALTGRVRSWVRSDDEVVVRTSMGEPKVDGVNGTHELNPFERPAHTVTTKTDAWTVMRVNRWQLRHSNMPNAAVRAEDEPAGVVAFGHASASVVWELVEGEHATCPRCGKPLFGVASTEIPCCSACGGAGLDASGTCWDCRGTGHPHPEDMPCGDLVAFLHRDEQTWCPAEVSPETVDGLVNGNQDNACERALDQPAGTLFFGARLNDVRWKVKGMVSAGMTGAGRPKDPETEPADTITGKGTAYWVPEDAEWTGQGSAADLERRQSPVPPERINDQSGGGDDGLWTVERPATTLASRDLVPHPGANANRFNDSTKSRNDGIRITVQEAAILQSFPADWPWAGDPAKPNSKTAQFTLVGNAVPPILAKHILAALAKGVLA